MLKISQITLINILPRLAQILQQTFLHLRQTRRNYMKRHSTTFQLSEIKSSRVLKLLLKLDVSKATSLDQISNKILKLAGPVICKQLTDLCNLSVKSGVFPNDWKLAKVSPIHKTGERNDANNYRPISVLLTIARIFEKHINEQLYDYLCKNDILDSRQSGFRSLHPTVTALFDLTNQWCFNIDRGMISGVVFLVVFLTKLEHVGVRGHSLEWFNSYLTNRYQFVYINGILSEQNMIKCGVPQGSIFGPLLFLIYINDLSNITDFEIMNI